MFHQKFAFATLLAVVACLSPSTAQVTNTGCCPADIEVVPNFDVEQYMGLWYEQEKYPFFQEQGKCITAQYILNADNSVDVINTQINISNGCPSSIQGNATLVENGKLNVYFPTGNNNSIRSNYWVLDTDYTSYSVVYSCYQIGASTYATNVWILSRERNPDAGTIVKAKCVLTNQKIDLTPLIVTDQTNCSA